MSQFLDDCFDAIPCILWAEDTFGIKIKDEDAEQFHTAGDLFNYIRLRIQSRQDPEAICPTAAAFYRLRRLLLRSGHPTRIHPDTPTASLLPPGDPRKHWPALANQLGFQLPHLCFSHSTQFDILFALFVPSICVFALGCQSGGILTAFLLAALTFFISLAACGFLMLWLQPRLGRAIPPEAQTIGDLAYLEAFTQIEANPPKSWSRHQAWVAVQSILAYSAGVSPRQIKKGTTFSDLNAQSL